MVCAGAALLLGGAPPATAGVNVEGELRLESDTAWRVYSPRVAQKFQNRMELDLTLGFGDAWRVFGRGRVVWDPVGRLVGDDPDFGQSPVDRWQVAGSDDLEAELQELYVDWRGRAGPARLDLRLGKQQVVWGQSFGLRVLDMVNPQDFREFILDDFVDARTATWGVRGDALIGDTAIQALLFPDFEPDVLADPESEFAFDPELRGLLPGLVGGGAAAVALGPQDDPSDADPSNWGYGFRVGRSVGSVDLALYYWDRIDTRGVFGRSLVPTRDASGRPVALNVLQREFLRVRTVGFSFATTFGDFGLWGEGGAGFGRGFVTNDPLDRDGFVRRPDLEYALGLDWTGWEPLFANLQFIQFVIFDHDRAIDLNAHREFLSLLLRFDLLGETLFPQLFVLYGLQDSESMLRPSLEWRATDRLAVTFGADFFTGPREGFLGQFAARRQCVPVPKGLPVPSTAGGCLFEPPPGRTSRVFLRFEYAFGFGR
jgi:hypothetical protein